MINQEALKFHSTSCSLRKIAANPLRAEETFSPAREAFLRSSIPELVSAKRLLDTDQNRTPDVLPSSNETSWPRLCDLVECSEQVDRCLGQTGHCFESISQDYRVDSPRCFLDNHTCALDHTCTSGMTDNHERTLLSFRTPPCIRLPLKRNVQSGLVNHCSFLPE